MSFNSYMFLLFFPAVALLYFTIPKKLQWVLLLVSSCLFYMAFIPVYILILFGTILVDYAAAILLEKTEGRAKKAVLVISIISTCAILFVFKYYGFARDNIQAIASLFNLGNPLPSWDIVLPIGLSFHTFQSLSYVIEVYRGNQKAERHLGYYALYVMFFPQLVAGPIERAKNLLHQLHEYHDFDEARFAEGARIALWGFFKKIVIADRLAIFVNEVYGNPTSFQGLPLIVATVFFAFQIYCDFSGYTDIAIGTARILGIDLMENFNRPYSARSLGEFWSHWHISLSTWFRDYVYIPLGLAGSGESEDATKSNARAALIVTFLLSGLWHGASWNFIFWGVLHGYMILLSTRLNRAIERLGNGKDGSPLVVKTEQAVTFSLVCFGWVFFRSDEVIDAFYMLLHIFKNWSGLALRPRFYDWAHNLFLNQTAADFLAAIALIALLQVVEKRQETSAQKDFIKTFAAWLRWPIYALLAFAILNGGVVKEIPFIYFQF